MSRSAFNMSRSEKDSISEEVKRSIDQSLLAFISSDDKTLSFPSSYSNIERKFIHLSAAEHGLKSKSTGKEPNRTVTLYKDNSSEMTIKLLKEDSLDTLEQLLYSQPVTEDETKFADRFKPFDRSSGMGSSQIPRTNMRRTRSFRGMLPILPHTEDIIASIHHSRVCLILGETGCGKTTQIPQMILEFSEEQHRPCNVICSMPRRVAAVAVSERVAFERGERVGDTVGYRIHLESRTSPRTCLTYCTNGVLLRCLLHKDDWLRNVSHIIIDEVHERDKMTDFSLIVLKYALVYHPNLKLIIMSATMNMEKFQNYFKDFPTPGERCSVVEVPGRMFKVKEIYLEHILEATNYMSPEMTLEEVNYPMYEYAEQTCVESLTEKLAQIDLSTKAEMDSLLLEALVKGTKDVFKNLVSFMNQHNIPVDYQHPECGRTALMAAVIHSDIDAFDDLIHMDPDVTVRSAEGETTQTLAEQAGDKDILELFNMYSMYYQNKKESEAAAASIRDIPLATQRMIAIYEKCHLKKEVDEDLILFALVTINDDGRDGAVLVFLPGYDQIMRVKNKIMENITKFKSKPLLIHLLHSQMKSEDQKKVFQPTPSGHRKVILSTNIAETSVTIDDVCFVIDCGKVKERMYDTISGAYKLDSDWISQSCAEQRKGRAGRTREGLCFRLYTRKRFQSFKLFKIPDLLRQPIAELCLQTKKLAPTGTPIAEFLAQAIDPPLPDATKSSIRLLKQMNALTENEDLTLTGQLLLEIPIDPRYGKMILTAILLQCLDPVLTIVCCLSTGELFKLPSDPAIKESIIWRRFQLSRNTFSDHMIYLNAFQEWENAASFKKQRKWCQDNYVSASHMEMISGTKKQILNHLRMNKYFGQDLNKYSGSWAVIKAALASGMYPNVAKIDKNRMCLQTRNELKVLIHPSSVLKCSLGSKKATKDEHCLSNLPLDWLVYDESRQTGPFNSLCNCTIVSPLTLWLFTGPTQIPPATQREAEDGSTVSLLRIDDFVNFTVDTRTAKFLHDLRVKLHALSNNVLYLRRPSNTAENIAMMDTMVWILDNEDAHIKLSKREKSRPGFLPSKTPKAKTEATTYRVQSNTPCCQQSNRGFVRGSQKEKNLSLDDAEEARASEAQALPEPSSSFTTTNEAQKKIRFIIIKNGTQDLIEEAFEQNLWPITGKTFKKIKEYSKNSTKVILIFAVKKPTKDNRIELQGYGRFLDFCRNDVPLHLKSKGYKRQLIFEWMQKLPLPLDASRDQVFTPILHLPDGGEIEDGLAQMTVAIWDSQFLTH